MYKRLLSLPLDENQSIFLFGPRGTGKTAWVKTNILESIYIDLLDYAMYSTLLAMPSRLENLIPPKFTGWIVIDEVQRIPELLNQIHKLIESRKIRFLLTGSSARSLRKKGVNLLAGRALTYHMHPLVLQEIKPEIDFNHILKYGLLPKAVSQSNPSKYLESYVENYVREEVLQEGLTRNIGAFNRFLEAASFSQGQLLNISEIARELSINRFVVANYFDILEDLLIGRRIPAFSYRAKRRVISHNKFYFFDAGIFQVLRPRGPLDSQAELEGALLESLFFQSLQALNDYLERNYKIYFWRTTNGLEVDFVLYGPHGLIAFEIKRSSTITPNMFKGLKAFKEEYPEAKTYFIFGGSQREYYEDIEALPFHDALSNLEKLI